MKLSPQLDGLVTEGDKVLKSLLKQAYERGAADMHARIMNAASQVNMPAASAAPASTQPPKDKPAKPAARQAAAKAKGKAKTSGKASRRAPRGALDSALHQALTEQPGLRIRDYETLAREIEPRISITSVGNTLRRLKGKKYRNDGDRWFLMKK